jgi:hypothetical protein
LIIILGNHVRSILSTCPYQISFFRIMSSNIVSCASIFPLIYSFVFLSNLEILAGRLNVSISVALILLIVRTVKVAVVHNVDIFYELAKKIDDQSI